MEQENPPLRDHGPPPAAASLLQMFHSASRVGFHGSQQFTNVHGDMNIYPPAPHSAFGQQPTGITGMAAAIENTQAAAGVIYSESANYCSHLLRQGRGFPLYIPGPQPNLPNEYLRNGVAIGDVGRVTPAGVFDFFFNIYLDAADPINANFVPDDFHPLARYVPRDVSQEWTAGSYVSSPSIQGWGPNALSDELPGSGFLFSCRGPSGALLALPHGASLEKLENVDAVRRYAAKNAESWYRYINEVRGRGLANGSLYLITGCEKSWSGGMASFQNVALGAKFQLSFRPPVDTDNGYNYRFQTGTPARTHCFESRSFRDGEQPPFNQTTFLHGFSISLGEEIWRRLVGDAVSEIQPLRLPNSQRSFIPSMASFFSWPLSLFGGTGEEEIKISPTSETVHPARAINSFLLFERPEATVVITHDDDWRDILRDDGTDTAIKDTRQLLQHISEQFSMKTQHGAIFLVSKSVTLPQFIPSLYIPSVQLSLHRNTPVVVAQTTSSSYAGEYAPGVVPAPEPGATIKQCMDANNDGDGNDDEGSGEFDLNALKCSHCHTRRTSVWRRNEDGDRVCNACGVYQRLRGKERPLALKRNKIKPRVRSMIQKGEAVIAVVGPTGSGKTSFINLISGSNLPVGTSLESCTTASPFEFDGWWVTLIDTPGFGNPSRSDIQIFESFIATTCVSSGVGFPFHIYRSSYHFSCQNGKKLAGVIYMHHIFDGLVDGMLKRDFEKFKQLWRSDNALENIVIATNMWSDDQIFKPFLTEGAHLVRHDKSLASAQAILRCVLKRQSSAFQIQEELVDQGTSMSGLTIGE
ncbi:hypothetical protein GGX14DRAFT_522612 [Mycena pura]|uniref:GATA-type domain-containing protein n=1 Tax=Mycena pura TaxID=153505 RepID=A0AAD6VF65_9AGAR|nr:hypothetical protein GGX14DRAFT_522612 [Mycena pura]